MARELTNIYEYDSYEYRRQLRKQKMQRRRKREVRKHITLMLLGVVLVIGIFLSFHAINSKANSDLSGVKYKYFTSISVAYGETLWSLADQYADEHYKNNEAYINEVIQINHLSSEKILAGQYLVIPYYSSEFIGATAKN